MLTPPSLPLQLLTLKTLDVIQIKQTEAFGDISITRTVRGCWGLLLLLLQLRPLFLPCVPQCAPPLSCRRTLQVPWKR